MSETPEGIHPPLKPKSEPKQLGRRDVLKGVVRVAGAAMTLRGGLALGQDGGKLITNLLGSDQKVDVAPIGTAATDTSSPSTTIIEQPKSADRADTPEDRLKESGLEEYIPFSNTYIHYKDKYGPVVGKWHDGSSFSFMQQLTDTLDGVMNGALSPTSEQVAFWSKGWGGKKDQASADALAHVNSITLENVSTPEFPDQVRKTLTFAAETMPGIALSYPAIIREVEMAGGSYGGKKINLSFVNDSTDVGWRNGVALHEGKHALDSAAVPTIKTYIDKADFARHADTYFAATMETVEEWVDTPIETLIAQKKPLFGIASSDNPPVAREDHKRYELQIAPYRDILEQIEIDTPELADLTKTEIDSLIWKRQIMFHSVIRKWVKLTQEGQAHPFLEDPNIQTMVNHIIEEVAHGFVFSPDDVRTKTIHGEKQREVIESTLRAFSTLPEPTLEGYYSAEADFEFGERQKTYEQFGMKLLSSDNSDSPGHIPHRIYSVPDSPKFYAEVFLGDETTRQFAFELPDSQFTGNDVVIEGITVEEKDKEDAARNSALTRSLLVKYRRGEEEGNAPLVHFLEDWNQVIIPGEGIIGGVLNIPKLVDPFPGHSVPFALNVRQKSDGAIIDTRETPVVFVNDKEYTAPESLPNKEVLEFIYETNGDTFNRFVLINQGENNGTMVKPLLRDSYGANLIAIFNNKEEEEVNPVDLIEYPEAPGRLVFTWGDSWGVQLNEKALNDFRTYQENPNITFLTPRLFRAVDPVTNEYVVGAELVFHGRTTDGTNQEMSYSIPVEEIFLVK